ncbi:MAG: sigma-70 family RNA polymerase sigma factor [Planctomycetes bacterium]|nr:sigma-70 family RNA polymerase sigma factor [Planctomycetota bacterium]
MTSSSSAFRTSPSLLMRVQADDQSAWTRLVELYAPLVYHWCRRANLGPDDAADVFQETFRAVARHIRDFRRDRPSDSFRGWLRTIAQNKIRDHYRRLKDEPKAVGGTDANLRLNAAADPISLEEDESEQSVVNQVLHRVLESIRGEFEERTWQAFWQVQIEGKSTSDVGAALGMTAAAVRKAKLRVLARLRAEMGELL